MQFVSLCYYAYFSEQLREIKLALGRQNKNRIRIKKAVNLEGKLLRWMESTPVYLQLQWFDTVEEARVSSELRNKRWNTEVTARDMLYLEKLGVSIQ